VKRPPQFLNSWLVLTVLLAAAFIILTIQGSKDLAAVAFLVIPLPLTVSPWYQDRTSPILRPPYSWEWDIRIGALLLLFGVSAWVLFPFYSQLLGIATDFILVLYVIVALIAGPARIARALWRRRQRNET